MVLAMVLTLFAVRPMSVSAVCFGDVPVGYYAKGLKGYKPATTTFKDVASSRWSYGYVEAAVKAGYFKGYSDENLQAREQYHKTRA